jgi:hypothetical protein
MVIGSVITHVKINDRKYELKFAEGFVKVDWAVEPVSPWCASHHFFLRELDPERYLKNPEKNSARVLVLAAHIRTQLVVLISP